MNKDREILELKSNIAELLAVMPGMGSQNHVGYFMIQFIFGVIRHAGHGLTEPCRIFHDAAYFWGCLAYRLILASNRCR